MSAQPIPAPHHSRDAIMALRATLAASLIERDAEIDAMLLGLVAQEHVLLVGPPGTGKSALATGVTKGLIGARVFSVLLTKFTTPEEIFGPIKLSALREDRYERSVDGYMPSSEIVFLDEIWKASSAILNTNLTLLQERAYDNGGARVACPLRLAIAASNEWPSAEDGQELGAVFDRFLIRRTVRTVSPANRARLLYDALPTVERSASLADIDAAAAEAKLIHVSDAAKTAIATMLDELAGAGIRPGDRRSRKAVGIARAAAWLDGASEVAPSHLECLGDVLWSSPEQAEKCVEIVTKIANPLGSAIMDIMREVQDILGKPMTDTATRMEAIKKLEVTQKKAKGLATANPGNKRAADLATYTSRHRGRLSAIEMGMDAESIAKAFGDLQ